MKSIAKLALILGILNILILPQFAAGQTSAPGAITGKILDEEGRVLKNIKIRIFAYQEGQFEDGIVTSEGDFGIDLPAGEWFLGAETGPESGFTARGINLPVTVSGNTIVKNIVLKRLTSMITGRVNSPAGIIIGKTVVNLSDSKENSGAILHSAETDKNGAYRFFVTAGKYLLRVFSSSRNGVVNPASRALELNRGQLANISFVFQSSDRKISGRTILRGTPQKARVWAWSDTGGYSETYSEASGQYALNVKSGDQWHVNASLESNGIAYQSKEILIEPVAQDVIQDLELFAVSFPLPSEKISEISPATGGSVSLENGMRISFQKNFAAAKKAVVKISPFSGNSQKSLKIVGFAYAINLFDENNQPINKLLKSAVLELPYTDEILVSAGASEERLEILFWDADASAWRSNGNSATIKNKNLVLGITDHFTEFVVTEPEAPTPSPPPIEGGGGASSGGGGGGGGGGNTISEPRPNLPAAPAIVTAKLSADGTAINVSGSTFIITVGESYILERSQNPDSGFVQIAANLRELLYRDSIVDSNLKAGQNYFYRFIAVNSRGRSNPSVAASVILPSDTQPPLLSAVETSFALASNGKVNVNLTFTTGEPATSEVNYGFTNTREFKEIKSNLVSLHNYTLRDLPPETSFQFSLTAKDEFGNAVITDPPTTLTTPALPQASPASQVQATPAPPAARFKPASIIFTRILRFGSFGNDVRELQIFLNTNGFRVAPAGPGSPGFETQFFGPATGAALSKFQEANSAAILSPLRLTQGTGNFGPSTRNFINSLRVSQ